MSIVVANSCTAAVWVGGPRPAHPGLRGYLAGESPLRSGKSLLTHCMCDSVIKIGKQTMKSALQRCDISCRDSKCNHSEADDETRSYVPIESAESRHAPQGLAVALLGVLRLMTGGGVTELRGPLGPPPSGSGCG